MTACDCLLQADRLEDWPSKIYNSLLAYAVPAVSATGAATGAAADCLDLVNVGCINIKIAGCIGIL